MGWLVKAAPRPLFWLVKECTNHALLKPPKAAMSVDVTNDNGLDNNNKKNNMIAW